MINHISKLFSMLIILSLVITGCNNDDDDFIGNWIQMADFDGIPRTEAICFTIGDRAYIGTGFDIDNKERLTDFWVYDSSKDFWTQIADLPGIGRNGAIAFSSSTRGYCGTGYDGDNKLKDFYEYDPEQNIWTQKNDFAGSARYGATAFYVDGNGYIGTGYDDNHLKDFWKYDITSDSWMQVTSIGGSKRRDAMNFVLNGEAYVLSGLSNGVYLHDMFKYDTENDSWIELGHLKDYEDDSYDDDYTVHRYKGATFVMDGKAYVTTGIQGNISTETWEYEPSTDRWEQKTDFEGSARSGAVGFTLNNRGYIATGGNGSYSFDDVWTINPEEEYEDRD